LLILITGTIGLLALLVLAFVGVARDRDEGDVTLGQVDSTAPADDNLAVYGRYFYDLGFHTNIGRRSVSLDLLLSGGPGKDGIPALTDVEFVATADAGLRDEVRGILVDFEGERRFYPFNILVWHEVLNDSIGDTHFAVTFCPLCGSGIVFDREVGGEVLEFGVSGLLYESNLIMYDQSTHSFWSQSLGEAIVGRYTGTRLEILPMQLLTFEEARRKYPDIRVLSDQTGFARDYARNPYSGYEETESLIFPVSVQDNRFFAKELMYVFRLDETSVAFPLEMLTEEKVEDVLEGRDVEAVREGGEISVTVDGRPVPGYIEMWFSWATQHQEDGLVWALE
jgi:hypothetical protein